ncbi:unnamed protein product [Gordionus sp. m RMFG-2023]
MNKINKKRARGISKSARAGIIFPVSRVGRYLRQLLVKHRFGIGAPIYLASVMEYLTAEIMELAGNAARDNKKSRITPRHILLAIMNDEELNRMLKGVTIPSGGVLPKILPELLQKKNQTDILLNHKVSSFSGIHKTKNLVNDIPYNVNKNISNKKKINQIIKIILEKSDINKLICDAVIIGLDEDGQFYIESKKIENELKAWIKQNNFDLTKSDLIDPSRTTHPTPKHPTVLQNFKQVILCRFDAKADENEAKPAKCLQILDDSLNYCLSLADQQGLKTVVIPSKLLSSVVSFGSADKNAGNSPMQDSAIFIMKVIQNYFKVTPASSLKQIYLMSPSNEYAQCYISALPKLGE